MNQILSADGSSFWLFFKKRCQNQVPLDCLSLAKNILDLSNYYRGEKFQNATKAAGNSNRVKHIFIDIDAIVNKSSFTKNTRKEIEYAIYGGLIEIINTEICENKLALMATTDFEDLKVVLGIKKSDVSEKVPIRCTCLNSESCEYCTGHCI